MRLLSIDKKKKLKIISLATAIAMVCNAMPMSRLAESIAPFFVVSARAEEYTDVDEVPTDQEITTMNISADTRRAADTFVSPIAISSASELADYSYYYVNDTGFASTHFNDCITITIPNTETIDSNYLGIGTEVSPFAGQIKFGGEDYNINLARSLFNYVYDSVTITNSGNGAVENLKINRTEDVPEYTSRPLLADHVKPNPNGSTPASWKVTLASASSHTYSGVIGEICSGAHVNLTFINDSNANVVSNGNGDTDKHVGAVCGLMNSCSVLAIDFTETTSGHSITSAHGNAGGLVGTMSGNSTLQIKNMPSASSSKTISSSFYAGGLVGEIFSTGIIDISALKVAGSEETRIPVAETVSASGGAGGLFGHYINTATEFDLANYNNTATVSGGNFGGVFGVLENTKDDSATSLELTIKNTSNAGTLNVKSGTTANTSGYFGGIAGKYTTNALANSLIIDGITLTAEAKAAYGAFGGVIGIVDSASAAYVQTKNTVTINAKGTDKSTSTYFGGLIGSTGSTGSKGVFVDLGNFTLSNNSESFNGGGIVGQFKNGVLRLHGNTNMSAAKAASGANCGQLVGANDNVLVYATGTGNSGDANWVFNRSNGSKADDLGTWGEVVRIANVEPDILTFDSTAHTVTLAAVTADSTDHDYKIGTPVDFVKTALNIQLNKGEDLDCLKFTSGSAAHSNILAGNITITNNVSLAGTGITGFMRDGGDSGMYTAILDGTKTATESDPSDTYAINLAVGETYGVGSSGQTEGMGQIYRHENNGLFAVLGGKVSNLKIDGTINANNCSGAMNIGGIAAKNGGNITLTKVIADETINYIEPDSVDSSGNGKNIGGYIGLVSSNNNVTIDGASSVTAKINLSGYHNKSNYYGGAIGKVSATNFEINFGGTGNTNKLTVAMEAAASNISESGSDGNGGGLIGYITNDGDYSKRIVNINNVDFNGCKVVNSASSNGGGFFGYSWLNTTTNINGVTVTNGEITNSSAPNVGVMCYSATGKWVVDSLTITKMSMTSGAGTSLGMIVNKAYDEKNGLYLDVLNKGYTLTRKSDDTGITLPNSLGTYDEIAAYSASNVISGGDGAGVISVNMNDARSVEGSSANKETKITETGTYQNKLTSASSSALVSEKYANSKSRYYYNLDVMNKLTGGEDLLLWSVNKYAASNISSEFEATSDHFGTTAAKNADLTGLSFYPLAKADDTIIGALTLKFGYSGIRSAESSSTLNTDSYLRDPKDQNQHYLMHSGLFIDQDAGKTLTINGKLSLAGDFLEDSTYRGVLISKTMKGNITVTDDGSIELDGIKPMNGASAYKDGYLLINNIARASDLVAAPSLTVKNVYTTKEYSDSTYIEGRTNETVAKSLLGAASGKGLNIVFSHIKLDARSLTDNAVKTDVALEALYNAYGTYNSIFTDSTLIASINTDQAAKLEYNYTKAEDWGTGNPRFVTYGKEVKDSLEYRDEEQRYYPDANGLNNDYTNPINNTALLDVYNFSSGFLPYVEKAYSNTTDSNGCFYRELKVNVQSVSLSNGCGTYNDPYIIKTTTEEDGGKVLTAIASFISSGDSKDLKEVVLPYDPTSFDSLAENTSGARWHSGENYHAKFTASGNTYISEDGKKTWNSDNVRLYLAGAYYKIDSDITIPGTYLGLGCATDSATGNYAFRGVIVGDKNANDTPKYTVTNKSAVPFIKVSNGCVVKDINIEVGSDISLDQGTNGYNDAYFGYYSQCKYYGGIIGEIMGGDNIIDNSYVTFASGKKVTLSGENGTIVPVGGYVGVVVFGGLIFKNMDASKTTTTSTGLNVVYTGKTFNLAQETQITSTTDETSGETTVSTENQEAWAAIYVNPIVGRVINGYAVNETTKFSIDEDGKYQDDNTSKRFDTKNTNNEDINTDLIHTLKNGTKHYTIADVKKSETNKLSVTPPTSATDDGTISIPNSQAFFILSLVTQSCAGTAQTANGGYSTSLSYGTNTTVYGMSHIADYSDVGKANITTSNTDYGYASSDTAANTAIPYIIRWYTADSSGNYPARCVTSTKGYYDINLNAKTTYSVSSYTYQLPDSFRGLGSVGFYNNNDTLASDKNRFCIKLDVMNGNSCTVDEDVYLNKYRYDNYFNTLHVGSNQQLDGDNNKTVLSGNTNTDNHGLGLFDSILMKDTDSAISNFIVSGSVKSAVFSNDYSTENQELKTVHTNEKCPDSSKGLLWLSVGGVCGWCRNGSSLAFANIKLNGLSISGSDFVGGLLGYSGHKSSSVYISQCNAENIMVMMTSSQNIETTEKSRNGIGSFVGKVQEGRVVIYGTAKKAANDDLTDYSTVIIKNISFADSSKEYYTSAGGLVGFAGNGCEIYDMRVLPSANVALTIGNDKTRFVGGMVGGMQSAASGGTTGTAVFENCVVEQININGSFAGGFYGGKWDSGWTTYSITLNNCKLIGSSVKHNTIYGNDLYSGIGYAGGFIGRLYPYTNIVKVNNKNTVTHNVLINDCVISNYDITAANTKTSYAGGFIGYASSATNSVTCYLHDSSIENCTIGANGNYAGGIIGKIVKKSANQLLGYNIKLDTITTGAGDKMGAWIGYVDTNDTTTSIQFTGMAIYGSGFDKNIGNWTVANNQANKNASFVFAAYDENMLSANPRVSELNKGTTVDMPKYPYVNVNPQSSMGTGEIISGDGAFKRSGFAPAVGESLSFTYTEGGETKEYTAARTTAAKIYSDIVAGTDTRRYTTFVDSPVTGTNTIKYYLNQKPGADGDRISTYKTEKGTMPEGMTENDDFAVIVIANHTDEETTNLINRYIQLVTNTSTDYTKSSDYFDIDIQTCKYENGKFVIDKSATAHGLTTTNVAGQKFALNGDYADSNNANTFTLVDVQFKDPLTAGTNSEKIAYHLYVPVYTIKQIEVTFSASAMTGTDSVKYQYGESTTVTNKYEADMESGKTHFDGLDTWVTQYIRYTYNKDDINALINSNNLNWHNDKVVKFNTKTASSTFKCLPDNTKMILVNPNGNADSFYYADGLNNNEKFTKYTTTNSSGAEFNNWEIDLSGFKDKGSTAFKPCDIKDLIADKLTVKDDGTPKLFTEVSVQNGIVPEHDIYRIDGLGNVHYYTYSSSGNVALAVDSNVNEDYYLSMYVPKSNDLYYYDIIAPEKLEGEKTASVTNGGTNINSYKYEVMVADLYEQETKVGINKLVVEPGNRQITSSNRELKVDVTTSISINNADAIAYLNNKSPALYHSFNLTFNGKSETGMTTTEIMGYDTANKPTVTATHTIDDTTTESTYDLQKNYLNVKNGNIGTKLYNKQLDPSNKQPLIIKSQVSIKFDDDLLDEQFPQGTAESNTGLYVAASTNLAYDQAKLAYTNMSVPYTPDNNYYYREAANTAKLQYTAENELDEYDNFGKLSQNYSRLGINGKGLTSETYMPVNTVAGYDVTNLTSTELEDADYVRLTLTLSKKTDTKDPETGQVTKAEYSAVDMSEYLSAVTVKSGTFSSSPVLSGNSLVVEIPKDRCSNSSNVYTFGIQFRAKTGAGFTDYANYKMTLKAEMLNEHKNGSGETVKDIIGNSVKSDYVVYTNAKVIPDILGSNT